MGDQSSRNIWAEWLDMEYRQAIWPTVHRISPAFDALGAI